MRVVFVGWAMCPTCKALEPFIENLVKQYNIKYHYIDAQDEWLWEQDRRFVSSQWITELPTIFFYDEKNNEILREWFRLPAFFEEFILLQLDDDTRE